MNCPKCGATIADNVKFCTECGNDLNVAISGENSQLLQTPSKKKKGSGCLVVLLVVVVLAIGFFAVMGFVISQISTSTTSERAQKEVEASEAAAVEYDNFYIKCLDQLGRPADEAIQNIGRPTDRNDESISYTQSTDKGTAVVFFDLEDGSVKRLRMMGPWNLFYTSSAELWEIFEIDPNEDMEVFVESEEAYRCYNVTDEIADFWVMFDSDTGQITFISAEIN